MTLINPIFSEWKSVGLELMIPMMYHDVWWKVIIVSSLSFRDKYRLRDRESFTIFVVTIPTALIASCNI